MQYIKNTFNKAKKTLNVSQNKDYMLYYATCVLRFLSFYLKRPNKKIDKWYIRVYGNSIEIFQRSERHSTDKGNVSFGDHIILDGVMLHKRPLRDVERPSRKYCMTVDG